MSRELKVTTVSIVVLVILAFGIFIRFWDLERMAYHHDESIHAWYSYRIYTGEEYHYDPTYHGPFLYHIGALSFLLFGDSDFTGRLPFVLAGILLLYIVFHSRKLFGDTRAYWMLAFCAISPTLTYFARFARNDVYIAAWMMGMVVFALSYIQFGKIRDFYLAVIFLGLLYCTKENSYMSGFILCSFLVIYVLCRLLFAILFSREEEKKAILDKVLVTRHVLTKFIILYGIFSFFMFFYVKIQVDKNTPEFVKILEQPEVESLGIGVIKPVLNKWMEDNQGFLWGWWLLALLITVVVYFFLEYARLEKIKASDSRSEPISTWFVDNSALLISVAMLFIMYSFLFTVMFQRPEGMKNGLIDYLSYWLGHQLIKPRIDNVAWYYLPRLFLYEFIAMVLSIIGIVYFIGKSIWSLGSDKPQEPEEPKKQKKDIPVPAGPFIGDPSISPVGFPLFLCYWFVASLVIYAILREKVPWLMTHQALPAALLAGYLMGEVQEYIKPGIIKKTIFAIAIIGIAYSVRTNVILNMYNNDDPRETIVYTQSTQDVKKIVEEVNQLCWRWLDRENTRVTVQGTGQWPLSWYLRKYKNIRWVPSVSDLESPIIITDDSEQRRMTALMGDDFAGKLFGLRAWWLPTEIRNDPNFLNKIGKYVLYRETWNPTGSSNLMYYVRSDLVGRGGEGGGTITEEGKTTKFPSGYKNAPIPVRPVQVWGEKGSGPGEFIKPKGLAIDNDGNIYAADTGNNRVQIFSSDGKFVRQFGGPGTAPGQFNDMGGIAVDKDGYIYVCDLWNNRIQKFSPSGDYISSIIDQRGKFYGPRDVKIDAYDHVYISDTGNKRIMVFDTEGKPIRSIGIGGKKEGRFEEQVGLAIDKDNLIYVADCGNKRIQVFTREGKFLKEWPVLGWDGLYTQPYMAYDPKGYIYATDSSTNILHKFDLNGQSVQQFGSKGTRPGQFSAAMGIAVDDSGNVYVADTDNNRIQKFARLGN